jgi:diguanylate cyclase (GGDEF)-like protein
MNPRASAAAVPIRAPFVEAADVRRDALIASYRKLAEVFHEVLSEQSVDSLLDRIADTLAELVPYDSLTIYQADETRRELFAVLARCDEWRDEIFRSRPAYGRGITGWAAEHREAVLTNAAHLDPRVYFVPGTPREPEALIAVPLVARGSLKGTLNIYRVGEHARFVEDEFELAKWFGDAAALALDNAQIRAGLEHQAQTDSLTGLFNHRFFHDRLRAELNRASRARDTVSLLVMDIDDFKRINDIHGHGVGDQLLVSLAELTTATVRDSDVVCRLGGEEFAVIMPSCGTDAALGLARRLRAQLAETEFEPAGRVTVSVGIAQGPEDATNPRALLACADAAMLTAKARGKDQVVHFQDASDVERPQEHGEGRDVRSIAHLKMLQSLAGKLNRLNDVHEIGMAIANELRVLLDYHNCRVYLREGDDLTPIAFRGDDCADCQEGLKALGCKVGQGVTGRTAETGRPQLVANGMKCDFALTIPGTERTEESLVAVPFLSGSRAIGVLVISQLGADQFDEDDVRLLEVLAGHASVSLEKARMYERQRREAERANLLLEFADTLFSAETAEAVAEEAVAATVRLLEVPEASFWRQDERSGRARCVAHSGEAVAEKTEEAIAPLQGVKGWIAVRPPAENPFHLDGPRMVLLDEVVRRASLALRRLRS